MHLDFLISTPQHPDVLVTQAIRFVIRVYVQVHVCCIDIVVVCFSNFIRN